MKKNLNKLLSLLLVFALIAGFTPIMAAAEGDEGVQPEQTSLDQMKDLADKAEAAAKEATDEAKEAAEALKETETAVADMTKEDGVVEKAEDAITEADGKVTENFLNEELADIAECAEEKDDAATQAVIDGAVKKVEGLVDEVEEAVKKTEAVVEAANSAVETAAKAATEAKDAIDAANVALENAQEAEKLYNELLQAAVTENNNEAYNALAEAETAMNEAWKDYSVAKADAEEKTEAAESMTEQAADVVAEAIKTANEAQAKADDLYSKWVDAEIAMKAALNNTGDADLIALEAERTKARNAALSAMESAKAAKRDAEKAYNKALEAGTIAGDLNDTAVKLVTKTNNVKGILAGKLDVAAKAAGYEVAPVEGEEAKEGTEGKTEYNPIFWDDGQQGNKLNKYPVGNTEPKFVLIKDGQLKVDTPDGQKDLLVIWVPEATEITKEQYKELIKEELKKAGQNINANWFKEGVVEIFVGEDTYVSDKNYTFSVEEGTDGIWRVMKKVTGTNEIKDEMSNLIFIGGTYTPGTEGTPGKDPIPGREVNFIPGQIENLVWETVAIEAPVLDLPGFIALVPGTVTPNEETGGNNGGGDTEEEGGTSEGGGGWTPYIPGGGNETTEEVNVIDEETPLGPAAPPAETVVAEVEEVFELLDEDVPLGAATPMQMPKTGVTDTTSTWMIALCLSAMAAIALAGGLLRKTKED